MGSRKTALETEGGGVRCVRGERWKQNLTKLGRERCGKGGGGTSNASSREGLAEVGIIE